MTTFDTVMFAVIVIGGALALYALGRHHGYARGWVEAVDRFKREDLR